MINATSNHPGGVNVCFTDGSVKFVKDTIEPADLVGPGDEAGRRSAQADTYRFEVDLPITEPAPPIGPPAAGGRFARGRSGPAVDSKSGNL